MKDLLNSDKFEKSKKNNPTIEKNAKPKKSVLISHELHHELKASALKYDMFIHEIINISFKEWKEKNESNEKK